MAKQALHKPPARTLAPKARKNNKFDVQGVIPTLLLSFGCGTGAAIVLLAIFAFVCERFSLPISAVRPMAMCAVWVGAAVSGYTLANRFGRQKLLCGLGCGVFYCLCLVLASYLATGEIYVEDGNAALPAALLLGSVIGGAVSALWAGNPRRAR